MTPPSSPPGSPIRIAIRWSNQPSVQAARRRPDREPHDAPPSPALQSTRGPCRPLAHRSARFARPAAASRRGGGASPAAPAVSALVGRAPEASPWFVRVRVELRFPHRFSSADAGAASSCASRSRAMARFDDAAARRRRRVRLDDRVDPPGLATGRRRCDGVSRQDGGAGAASSSRLRSWAALSWFVRRQPRKGRPGRAPSYRRISDGDEIPLHPFSGARQPFSGAPLS